MEDVKMNKREYILNKFNRQQTICRTTRIGWVSYSPVNGGCWKVWHNFDNETTKSEKISMDVAISQLVRNFWQIG